MKATPLALCLALFVCLTVLAEHPVAFEAQWLAVDLNEGVAVADYDNHGKDELTTGKRVRAHNGKDPGGKQPPLVVYYTWDKTATKFTQHIIENGSVGIGLQIRTADLDADGDLDIVLAGKDGTQILWNQSDPS